jgi:catechol 2,3-dioxygenase-like lactoylglutathione lyase family enzyme
MTDTLNPQTTTRIKDAPARILAQRLHHNARVVKDHEVTRRFYEDVLGLPLVATWTEKADFPEAGGEVAYCHTFYGLADGGALAFFGFADPAVYELYKQPIATGGFNHLAMAVSKEDQDEIKARLEAAGFGSFVIDHGYCLSLYTLDPDQLIVEFTSDPANVAEINADQNKHAHATLKRWMAGDLTINNDLQPGSPNGR